MNLYHILSSENYRCKVVSVGETREPNDKITEGNSSTERTNRFTAERIKKECEIYFESFS
jgi:hypothetical protein